VAEDRHASMPELAKPLEQRAHPESDDAAEVPPRSTRAGRDARPEGPVSRWRRRRARKALLLDLGALVYELHRRGRRAPELLRAKAAALDELDVHARPGHRDVDGPRACPECGEQVAPDQLVCLGCGRRGELAEPRPHRVPLAGIAATAIVVGLVGAGLFALSELTGDETPGIAEDEPVLRAGSVPGRDAGTSARGGRDRTEDRRGAVAGYTASGGGSAGGSEPAGADLGRARPQKASAYTVVLVTSSDRAGARRVARDAARSGLEVGLLRSDEYDLGEGLWIVAAGRLDDHAQAARRAARLAKRYPGAYAQLLKAGG
jgi:hypothetical protein